MSVVISTDDDTDNGQSEWEELETNDAANCLSDQLGNCMSEQLGTDTVIAELEEQFCNGKDNCKAEQLGTETVIAELEAQSTDDDTDNGQSEWEELETNDAANCLSEQLESNVPDNCMSEQLGTDTVSAELEEQFCNGKNNCKAEQFATETVIAELEGQFCIGKEIEGIHDAYLKYCEYGSCHGFGVRKGKQKYFSGTTDVRRKEFYCSCRGFYQDNQEAVDVARTYSRQHQRTGCHAMICIKRLFGKSWNVSKFVKEHNHELLSPDKTYLLRSVRNLSSHNKAVMDALNSAGVKVARSFRFLQTQAGGVQHVGFTKIDAFNYADRLKAKTRVPNGDSRALMNFFMEKSNGEESFYWRVKQDSEGRIMHIFFRDSRCLTDYEAFGDVLMVDTTYRTNKYDMVVAPFVGVNHHKQNILFGMGLLSTETTSDFKWLFNVFLESMKGREPHVVFTDQCQAMMSAIDAVFRNASHRLCQWHINRNVTAHFGALNMNSEFRQMWNRCTKGVETEDEFERLWGIMKKYITKNESWFRTMYSLKRRWASVFTHDLFCCGMVATSRCESTNSSLKDQCESTHTLFEFVQCYERMKNDWRTRESASDVNNRGNPGTCAISNPLLRTASRSLTRAVYTLFEKQMVQMLNYDIGEQTVAEDGCVIQVKRMQPETDHVDKQEDVDSYKQEDVDSDKEANDHSSDDEGNKGENGDRMGPCEGGSSVHEDILLKSLVRTVHFDPATNLARCSCKTWETMGILCRHILKVYNSRSIKVLPSCYLLPRWSKDAKLRLLESRRQSTEGPKLDGLEQLAYANFFMRLSKEVVDECRYVPTCRIESMKKMKEVRRSMLVMMDKHRSSYEGGVRVGAETNTTYADEFRDPPPSKRRVKKKQSQDIPKSHWDVKTTRSKKKKSTGTEDRADEPKTLEEILKTGAAIISSQIKASRFEQSQSQSHRIPTEDDVHKQTEGGGILPTQQSYVNDSTEMRLGIADVWLIN